MKKTLFYLLIIIITLPSIISAEEKDSISHRGRALKLFREELLKYIEE